MDQKGSYSNRDRDRVERSTFKRERPSPYPKDGRGFRSSPRGPPFWRVFVNNISYEEKWQNLKDTFRKMVGEVTYVELFTDDNGKSRGYGVIEFKDKETCEMAIEKMNRFEINGRKLVVKADYDGELVRKMLVRDGVVRGPPMPGLPPPMPGRPGPHPPMPPPMGRMGMSNHPNEPGSMDSMVPGLGPMGSTVFVANLDYKVTYSKLKEVFQLAGRVVKVDLMLDKDNKSRGMATVTYDDPMEASQAISMLNNQKLFDRTMVVKIDKGNPRDKGIPELPSGLSGIGPPLNIRQRESGGMGDAPPMGRHSYGMGNSNSLGGWSSLGGYGNGSDVGSMREMNRNGGSGSNPLAAGLTALNQQANRLSETLQASSLAGASLGLAGIAGLGLGDLSGIGLGGNRDTIDQRLLDQHRLRLLAAARGVSMSDRERIEMDIARVDNRIRDIDRTLAATEKGGYNQQKHPPMPPPMGSVRQEQRGGSIRVPGTTVFVRNLPFSLTWQQLRDRFTRCGNVMYADIKMDNGKSRGFGNVRFESPDQAQAAVRYFNGMDFEGRKIEVHIDHRG
uniref:Myelin expression factor 2 n=1 Tax=Phallusia mammillata TaxID=59560 RepID=A0A6F9DMF9_9ASCI|nr:myelin expression factor 2 [Phallusia mammillata]